MKRIFITNQLLIIARSYGVDPFNGRPCNFDKPLVNLKNLKVDTRFSPSQKKYIERIIKNYTRINSLKPSEMIAEKKEFDNLVSEADLSVKIGGSCFYEHIVEAMRYKELRKKNFLPIIADLGIKSCVYCNAQLTIITEIDTSGNKIARLELDHFLPKSKYPFLCTSFFNLYPVCGNCNRLKSTKDLQFNLYAENKNETLNPFVFSVTNKSLAKFMISRIEEDIDIRFKSTDVGSALATDHDNRLHITGIYNTQKDIVAELIRNKEIYTKSYKQDLVNKYPQLFTSQNEINRMLIGNYYLVDDIHKRPLAKFMQDIAKQLKLI